jgi:hypothetical protein
VVEYALMKLIDLTGRRFGHLTVVGRPENRGRGTRWSVVCDCGKFHTVLGVNLRKGRTKSCGCKQRERRGQPTHGRTKSPEYRAWVAAKQRTTNPNYRRGWHYYASRGIRMCDRWLYGEDGKPGSECFLEDMGPRPSPKHSLDRIDNNGPYSPQNCRWETPREQNNNKRNNRRVQVNGKSFTVAELARETGVPLSTLRDRIAKGRPLERLLEPVSSKKKV